MQLKLLLKVKKIIRDSSSSRSSEDPSSDDLKILKTTTRQAIEAREGKPGPSDSEAIEARKGKPGPSSGVSQFVNNTGIINIDENSVLDLGNSYFLESEASNNVTMHTLNMPSREGIENRDSNQQEDRENNGTRSLRRKSKSRKQNKVGHSNARGSVPVLSPSEVPDFLADQYEPVHEGRDYIVREKKNRS